MEVRAQKWICTSLIFFVCAAFLHCLYFIYAREIYVRTHVNIPLITTTDVDGIFNVFLAKSNTWVAFPLVTALLSVNEYHLR